MLIDILQVIGDGMERVMLVHATVALQYQAMDGSLFFLGWYSDDSNEYQTSDEYKSFRIFIWHVKTLKIKIYKLYIWSYAKCDECYI